MTTNIRLYPWYTAASSLLFWMPIFFLFFNQYVSLSEFLQLGAVYYFAVVLLEVPSGYCSDRFGRRFVLLGSSLSMLLAMLVFVSFPGWPGFVSAQVMLAASFALRSGSDTALLYDSLAALGRESEYGERETNAHRIGLIAMSAAALLGGWSGSYTLWFPYLLSAIAAMAGLLLCVRFTEPVPMASVQEGMFRQISSCIGYLRDRHLAWISGYFILTYVLAHIPYEFYQPYIKLLASHTVLLNDLLQSAPMVAGVVTAVSTAVGALGASVSLWASRQMGLVGFLFGATAVQCLIIGTMAFVLSPGLLLMLMWRGFPMALVHGPVLEATTPRLASNHRATFLSLQSLSGRLSFSALLWMLSAGLGEAGYLSWPLLSALLKISLWIGLAGMLVLMVSRSAVQERMR